MNKKKKKPKKDTQPIIVCHWKNFQKSAQIGNNSIFFKQIEKKTYTKQRKANEWMNVCKSTWCLCLWAEIIILDSFVFPYADLVARVCSSIRSLFHFIFFSSLHTQFSSVVRVFPDTQHFRMSFFAEYDVSVFVFTVQLFSVQGLVRTISDCRFCHYHYSYHFYYYHCNKRSENGKKNSANLFQRYSYSLHCQRHYHCPSTNS